MIISVGIATKANDQQDPNYSSGIVVTLYTHHDLEEQAYMKAISERREYLKASLAPEDFINGYPAHDTPENLQKEYQHQYDIIDNYDDFIEDDMDATHAFYYEDGSLAPTVTYVSYDPKAENTYLIVDGIKRFAFSIRK